MPEGLIELPKFILKRGFIKDGFPNDQFTPEAKPQGIGPIWPPFADLRTFPMRGHR